jgi:hypothetical protein
VNHPSPAIVGEYATERIMRQAHFSARRQPAPPNLQSLASNLPLPYKSPFPLHKALTRPGYRMVSGSRGAVQAKEQQRWFADLGQA